MEQDLIERQVLYVLGIDVLQSGDEVPGRFFTALTQALFRLTDAQLEQHRDDGVDSQGWIATALLDYRSGRLQEVYRYGGVEIG